MRCTNHRQRGFTLLELVLVLFILAILTTTSLSFLESEDGQQRYQQSLQRFDAIGVALFEEKQFRGNDFLSGFIVDNGSLPDGTTDLSPLTENDTDWSIVTTETWVDFDYLRPYYYDVDNVETELPDNDLYKLGKGFRGPYVSNARDSDNQLKDGWGVDFNITTATATTFAYTFDSNSPITDVPFSINTTSITRTIDENDWTILPSSLNVTVTNDGTGAANLRVALLIFKNDSVAGDGSEDADLWQTFYFDFTGLAAGNSINSSSQTWSTDGSLPNLTRVPAGEHLILLLDSDATIVSSGDDIVDVSRLIVFPGTATQPEISLEFP